MTVRIVSSDLIATDATALQLAGVQSRLVVLPGVTVAVEETVPSATDLVGIRALDASQSVTVGGFVAADYGLYVDGNGARVDITTTGQVVGTSQTGVALRGSGATVVNAGFVGGQTGIDSSGAGGTVVNTGTISGVTAINFGLGSGSVTNSGTISADLTGVMVASGLVTNIGTIVSDGVGITAQSFTSITNSGTIAGVNGGVVFTGTTAQELVNTGRIIGGVIISVGGATIDTRDGIITGFVGLSGANITYLGGNARDWVGGQMSDSTVDLGAGDDVFRLGGLLNGNEVEGGVGVDILDARSFVSIEVDLAQGTVGSGSLRVEGFTGFEQVRGTGGNDRLTGDGGANRLSGDTGADTVDGGAGNDRLFGGADADRVIGGDGNDRLGGEADNDVLEGGAGRDTLVGGLGRDVMMGGEDADLFLFRTLDEAVPGAGQFDRIQDFVVGVDRIDLSGIDARPGTPVDEAFVFVGTAAITGAGQLRVRQTGSTTFLEASFDTPTPVTLLRLDGLLAVTAADLVL